MFSPQRLFGNRPGKIRNSRRAREKFLRPFIQQLEDRTMLSTLVVNNPTDAHVANETSLREAIVQANIDAAAAKSDSIVFDASLGSHTITLTQGQLELSGAGSGTITIDGSSPGTPIALRAGPDHRVLVIDSGVNAVLTNLSMLGGHAGSTNPGGDIFNAGTLMVSNAILSQGYASYGGGIENQGALTLSNVTLTSNNANNSGGAIDNTGTFRERLDVHQQLCPFRRCHLERWNADDRQLDLLQQLGGQFGRGHQQLQFWPLPITGGFFTGNSAANAAPFAILPPRRRP